MKNKSTIYLYILIAVFTLFVGASTYAFFAGDNNITSKANVTAKTGSMYTFTSTSATNFELGLTSADMQQSLSGNYVNSTVGTINVNLNSPVGTTTTCSFDLLFTWNSPDKYLTSNVELPFVYKGVRYDYEFSMLVKDGENVVFNERDLSKVNRGNGFNGNSGTIAEDLSIVSNGKNISKTYNIEARIYNLPVNQPNLIGKNMKASIKVDNVNCNVIDDPTAAGTIYAMMKNGAVSDSSINFGTAPTVESGFGKFLRSTTENDTFPVYYYRGIVDNNNLILDGFCWKIIRTTETGGIKIIYNGISDNGTCNNTGTATQLTDLVDFNESYKSVSDTGYMYGTRYEYSSKSMSSQTGTYIYSNTVDYKNGVYELIDTYASTSWSTDRKTLASKYHYTCFLDGNTCTGSVYYIYYFGSSSTAYYITLNGEKEIEEVKENMFKNENDSVLKEAVDTWYEANLIDKEHLLEDTVWCNDRSLNSGPLKSKDTNSTSYNLFGPYNRLMSSPYEPTFSCNKNDSFTKDDLARGNGALDNPVGVLTADEYTLAGNGRAGYSTSSYLFSGERQWTLSPIGYDEYHAGALCTYDDGRLYTADTSVSLAVRPAVSLKPGTKLVGNGDGSSSRPYLVE